MINDKMIEKLNAYPADVRELAMEALRLSGLQHPESAIADQLQSVVRRLAKRQDGDN